jgi:hypothetical protein
MCEKVENVRIEKRLKGWRYNRKNTITERAGRRKV